jgi:hypothetical protein
MRNALRGLRASIVLFVVGFAIGASATVAVADSYSSWKLFGPLNGETYKNRAWVLTETSYIQGRTGAYSTSGSVGGGWIGVLPKLYKGTSLCKSTGYQYTSGTSTGIDAPTSGNCGSGTYHSQGSSAHWMGSYYSYVSTYVSPNQNW